MKPGSCYRSAFPTELKPISPFPMTATSPSLLYIHGFNSSPESHKARQLQAAFGHLGLAEGLRVPALHHHPRQAIAQLERAIAELGRPVLVGSSLVATMRPIWRSAMAWRRSWSIRRSPRIAPSTATWARRPTTTAARPGNSPRTTWRRWPNWKSRTCNVPNATGMAADRRRNPRLSRRAGLLPSLRATYPGRRRPRFPGLRPAPAGAAGVRRLPVGAVARHRLFDF